MAWLNLTNNDMQALINLKALYNIYTGSSLKKSFGIKGTLREFLCGDGTFLYLDSGGGGMNLYM